MSRDRTGLEEMKRRSGQMGVPVIAVDDQVVVGFDRPRLEALLSRAAPRRPSLGISIADASRQTMKAGSVPIFGAFVGKVAPGSPGARAGIQPGDIITEANLRPVNSAADLEKVLSGLTPGSRLSLIVLRGDKRGKVDVTL